MNFFKNVTSFQNLKEQFRTLAKKYHPDAGGSAEMMKELNLEYEALFPIWKAKVEKETNKTINETAKSTAKQFYTENGWSGSNYNSALSLKEIAQIVRTYIKEKYPLYKFSVRTSYASMCQELHVKLKESPIEIYKSFEDMTDDDKSECMRQMRLSGKFTLSCWYDEELRTEFERVWSEPYGDEYRCLNDVTKAVVEDVDRFVNSYNYNDCDGMIDYFDVNFYYFGCFNGRGVKIVPKTLRVAKAKDEVKVKTDKDCYEITEDTHTKTGDKIWVVKLTKDLSREDYLKEKSIMKDKGGYYSKFKHGFVFKERPCF